MNTHFDITYEVVDPATQKTEFVVADRLIAEIQYEKGYTVYERHTTATQHTSFKRTITNSILLWSDNPEIEEDYNEDANNTDE